MSITTILFDLDGTLLPMDQEQFGRAYMKGLTVAAEPAGYSPKLLSTAFINGIVAMVKNNGVILVALFLAAMGAVLTIIGPDKIGEMTTLMQQGLFGKIDLPAIAELGVFLVMIYAAGALFNYIVDLTPQRNGMTLRTMIWYWTVPVLG